MPRPETDTTTTGVFWIIETDAKGVNRYVCDLQRGSGSATALSIHHNYSRLESEDESRIVAGSALAPGTGPGGDTLASISAPADWLSEWRGCRAVGMATAQKRSARARSVR